MTSIINLHYILFYIQKEFTLKLQFITCLYICFGEGVLCFPLGSREPGKIQENYSGSVVFAGRVTGSEVIEEASYQAGTFSNDSI